MADRRTTGERGGRTKASRPTEAPPAQLRSNDGFSSADLTSKASIRHAAFTLFAGQGVRATSIRQIAELANVSPSLVLHHFGSKAGVEEAVSQWALQYVRRRGSEVEPTGTPAEVIARRLLSAERMADEIPLLGDYLRRTVLEMSPGAVEWFAELVRSCAASLSTLEQTSMARPSNDLDAEATLVVIITLAPFLLRPLIEGALGADDDDELNARWRAAELELFTSPLYPPEPVDGAAG